MKKLNKDAVLNICSNLIVIIVVLCVFAFAIQPEKIASSSGGVLLSPYYNGNKNKKEVSLMFNVYQHTDYVLDIIDTLNDFNVKATFFVGGCWADDNAECLKKIVGDGHEIANHGYFHKDHNSLNYDMNKEEIYNTQIIVKALCGEQTKLFAPPSGSFNTSTLEACLDLNYKCIMWSKDTIDWRDKDSSLIYKRATSNLENGDLILMHPTESTVKALPNVLTFFKSEGFKQVTVSQNIQGE